MSGDKLTYYEWYDKNVNPKSIVEGNISIHDFGAIVVRAVFRGDIVEYKGESPQNTKEGVALQPTTAPCCSGAAPTLPEEPSTSA